MFLNQYLLHVLRENFDNVDITEDSVCALRNLTNHHNQVRALQSYHVILVIL